MRESIDSGCEKPATCLVLRLITISLPSLGLLRTLLERGTWLPGMGLRKTKNADIFKNYVCTRRCALVGAVFWSKKRTLQTDRHSCDTPVCQWLMVECNEFVCWKTKKIQLHQFRCKYRISACHTRLPYGRGSWFPTPVCQVTKCISHQFSSACLSKYSKYLPQA